MIVRPRPSAWQLFFILRGSVVPHIAPQILLAALLGFAVAIGQRYYPVFFPSFTIVPFSLIGLAFSIFLGFRNSASYERYWEGRKLWGQLVIDTRSLARQALTLMGPSGKEPSGTTETAEARAMAQVMIRKLIAFTYALKHHLRGTDAATDLAKLWPSDDAATPLGRSNVPDAVLLSLSTDLRQCRDRQWVSDQLLRAMDERLTSLATVLAACERIRNTPLPFAYTLLLHRTAYLYCFLLPFGLVETIGLMTPLVVAIVSYTFFGLDALGDDIEEPFGDLPNDLPLDALSRAIEINLREAMGERDLPPPLAPVDFCLM
ncbi:MAG TPA: bestrophin family ion channel [Dongiaceae bacterium]|nr:bestrophin family ion channel [Dongiaceae bacterium]